MLLVLSVALLLALIIFAKINAFLALTITALFTPGWRAVWLLPCWLGCFFWGKVFLPKTKTC